MRISSASADSISLVPHCISLSVDAGDTVKKAIKTDISIAVTSCKLNQIIMVLSLKQTLCLQLRNDVSFLSY